MPKPTSIVQRDRIKRARALISVGGFGEHDVLQTRFESLGNELSLRASAFDQLRMIGKQTANFEKLQNLSAAFKYASLRLSNIFARLHLLEFIRSEIASIPEEDRLAEMTKPPSEGNPWMWNVYAGLAIKDFHADISSAMDSIAPLVIQLEGELEETDRSPGFYDIRKDRHRRYRKQIPSDIRHIVDQTDRWWPAVNKVRDVVMHREHLQIVFPTLGDNDGLFFQIYEGVYSPMIVHPELMYPDGKNVVDLSLYSGFVIAELLVFLEDLVDPIAHRLKIGSLTPSMRAGNFRRLTSSFDRLESLTT